MPASCYFRKMVFNPENPTVIYATGYDYSTSPYRAVLVRSDNGGESWNAFYFDTSSTSAYGYSIAVDPVDTATIYAGGYRASGMTMVCRSTARGVTWVRCPDFLSCGNIISIAVNPRDPLDVWSLEGSG